MTVREFLSEDIEIDVYDDLCWELGICYIGPLELTQEGEEYFKNILDLGVKVGDGSAIIEIDDPQESVWEDRLDLAWILFSAAAGYCSESDYQKWFKVNDDN